MLTDQQKKEMLDYIGQGANHEDLLAAGYTAEQITEIEKDDVPTNLMQGPPTDQGTLQPYTPTYRDNIRGNVKGLAEWFGADKVTADKVARGIAGQEVPTDGSLGIGIIDLTPLGILPGTQEAVKSVKRAYNADDKTGMALGAIDAVANVAGIIPGVAGAVKGVGKLSKAMSEGFDSASLGMNKLFNPKRFQKHPHTVKAEWEKPFPRIGDNGGPELDPFEQVPFEDNTYTDLQFESYIPDFISQLDVPKNGIKGSQFLKEIRDTPAIKNSEWDYLGVEIDPNKRYTKEELLDTVYKNGGLDRNVNTYKGFGSHQRQDKEAGLLDPEVDYGELTIGDIPGQEPKFSANSQHYGPDTLAHTRYSVRKDIKTGEKYLLAEELQSDLLQKGWEKPINPENFDWYKEFDKKFFLENWHSESSNNVFGAIPKEKLKNLVEAYKKYNTIDVRDGEGFDAASDVYHFLYKDLEKTIDDIIPTLPTTNDWGDVLHYNRPKDYLKNIMSFVRAISVELQTKSGLKNPPITKISESVRLLGDALLGRAAELGVNKVVFPPFERIVKARVGDDTSEYAEEFTKKALDPKSGFYNTYVTALNKYVKDLKDEFGDAVKVYQKPMNYKDHLPKPEFRESYFDIIGQFYPNGRFGRRTVNDVQDELIRWSSANDMLNGVANNFLEAIGQAGYDIGDLIEVLDVEGESFKLGTYLEDRLPTKKLSAPKGKALPNIGIEIDIKDLGKTYDLTRPKFAEGGVVEKDPVSGNTVPPGSLPEEVRDNVDAKLSEGEYVLPADVVRYFGLDYIEKLVGKAKKGMAELDAQGRIGGQGEDDLPFSPEELQAHEAEMATQPQQATPVAMAEGGMVPSQNDLYGSQNIFDEIDPETGLPKWMSKNKSVTTDRKTPMIGSGKGREGSGFVAPTGLAGSVDQWGPEDFLNYTKNKDSLINKGIETGVSTLVPFGGLAMKARKGYLDRNVPVEMDRMIQSGKDRDGNPLSAQQLADLKAAREQLASGASTTPTGMLSGIKDTINTGFKNLFGDSGRDRTEANSQSISQGSKPSTPTTDNDKKDFARGGYVSRRKH